MGGGDPKCFINLENALASIENHMKPFLEATSIEDITQDMSDVDRAKVNIALAYSINALFYMYLKTQGVDPNTHPVKKELSRIRSYIEKVKTTETLAKGRSLKVDVDASNRFIHNALSSDQVYVKALNENQNENQNKTLTTQESNPQNSKKRKRKKQKKSG